MIISTGQCNQDYGQYAMNHGRDRQSHRNRIGIIRTLANIGHTIQTSPLHSIIELRNYKYSLILVG